MSIADNARRLNDRYDPLAPAPFDTYTLMTRAQIKTMIAAAITYDRAHSNIPRRVTAMEQDLLMIGERMSTVEQAEAERWAEVGDLAGRVLAELDSLRQQVGVLVADQQTAVDAGVAAERQANAQADLDRLDALAAKLKAALPVAVPEIPTPDPGQPAVDDAGVSTDDVLADDSVGGSGDTGSSGDDPF